MNAKAMIAAVLLTTSAGAYADDPYSIDDGARQYDWTTCINEKTETCKNACQTSEDVNCQDECNTMASDKCQTEGLQPPDSTN